MSTDRELVEAAAQLLDSRIGSKPGSAFRARLARALRDLADAKNIDCASLVGALGSDASLLDQLLERITIQESGFFRHPEQFENIVRTLLPTIDGPLRAWSAACANGQEAYSLAMVVNEAGGSGSVLASDISPAAVRRTSAGHYHDHEMRGVSAGRRRQHFVVSGKGWQAQPRLRDMVSVQRHNLLDPIPPQVAECHVVMCRNVLIYLSQRHSELFLSRLADLMDPTAHLFIGGAETLWQLTDRFEPIAIGACFVYRPRASRAQPPIKAARPVVRAIAASRTLPASRTFPASDGPPPAQSASIDVTDHDQEQLGRELLASGSVPQAIVAFRQWAFLSPENPAAHLHLALALDDANERLMARRAYRAALTALDRCNPDRLLHVLEGYERSALRRLLVDRSRAEGTGPEVADLSTTRSAQRDRQQT